MTQTERTLLTATAIVLVAGGATWLALGGLSSLRGGSRSPVPRPPEPIADANPGMGSPGEIPGLGRAPGEPDGGDHRTTGATVKPGLRAPFGPDDSDPVRVKAMLRDLLAAENPRWDLIAQWLGVLEVPLDLETRVAIQNQLVHGNAAGAIQAYERIRDGTVVPDLLKLLDDPTLDDHDRNNVLTALSSIPAGDVALVVTGIEARLKNDFAHDLPYLRAIAKEGGAEAARALVEAITRSTETAKWSVEVWRELDLRKSKEASEVLATALADKTRGVSAQIALAALAGKPGASPALVEALAALDAPDQNDMVRRQALSSLAATGDDKAFAHLLDVASKPGGDYASVAAAAIGATTSASTESRARLVDVVKTTDDEHLREMAIEALGNVKEATAVPLLSEYLSKGGDLVRKQAAIALGHVGPAAAEAVPQLERAFQTGDDALKSHIAIALGSIGTKEALNILRQLLLLDLPPRVKATVANAVNRIVESQRPQ